MTVRPPAVRYILAALMLLVFVVCRSETPTASSPAGAITHPIVAAPIPSAARSNALPGMPPVPVERNVYADAGAGMLAPAVRADRPLVYVLDVRAGDVRVIDPETYEVVAKWSIPGGGSPDMGDLTADGSQLWLSGRYNQEVYVLSTADGHLIKRIPAGPEPHGLCVWPQPGRYSLGHTGITR